MAAASIGFELNPSARRLSLRQVKRSRGLTLCGSLAVVAKIDSKARTAEQDVQSHLDSVKKRIAEDRTKLAAAQADIKKWADEREAVAVEKIAEWKAKLEKAKLKSRAEAAERYAAGAAVVAWAAVDEAEQASLEAWLARKDADSALGTKVA